MESNAVGISCLGDVGGKQGSGGGRGGCAALPNAAMNAESKTYNQVHRLLDPIIDFTTSQCGCDPIAFAAGTGGRYKPQNSVVDESEYMDDREPSATAAPYTPYGDGGGGGQTADSTTLLDSKSAPFSDSREALEERGQQLEDLNRQTSKLESAGETFAGLAKQLKETTKQKGD